MKHNRCIAAKDEIMKDNEYLMASTAFVHEDREDGKLVSVEDLNMAAGAEALEDREGLRSLDGLSLADLGYDAETLEESDISPSELVDYDCIDQLWYEGRLDPPEDIHIDGEWQDGHFISDRYAEKLGWPDAGALATFNEETA